jgi:hypothetical protein
LGPFLVPPTCATYTLNSLESCQIICWVQFKTYMTHVWVSNLGELRLNLWVLFSKLQSDCFDDMTKKQHLDRPFLLMDYWVINHFHFVFFVNFHRENMHFGFIFLNLRFNFPKTVGEKYEWFFGFKSLITNNLIDLNFSICTITNNFPKTVGHSGWLIHSDWANVETLSTATGWGWWLVNLGKWLVTGRSGWYLFGHFLKP